MELNVDPPTTQFLVTGFSLYFVNLIVPARQMLAHCLGILL